MSLDLPMEQADPDVEEFRRAYNNFDAAVGLALAARLEGRVDHDAGSINSVLGHDPALTSRHREYVLERDISAAAHRASSLRLSRGGDDPTRVSSLRTLEIIFEYAFEGLHGIMGKVAMSEALAAVARQMLDEQYEGCHVRFTMGQFIDHQALAKRERKLEKERQMHELDQALNEAHD